MYAMASSSPPSNAGSNSAALCVSLRPSALTSHRRRERKDTQRAAESSLRLIIAGARLRNLVSLGARIVSVFRSIGIVIAIAVVFLFGVATTVYLSLRSPEVKVPDVVGKDRFEAEKILADADLKFRVRATRPSTQAKPDTVLFQLPRPGEVVKTGQTVAMDISRAAKEGETPETVIPEEPAENRNSNASANTNENKPKRPRNRNANDNANSNKNTNANGNTNRPVNINRPNANASVPNVNATPRSNVNRNVNVNRSDQRNSNSRPANDNKRPAPPRPTPNQ
jgi:PASTA domain